MSKSIKIVAAMRRSKQSTNTQRKKTNQNDAAPQRESKRNLILSMLRRKQGASLAEMQAASGWQAHSLRGFMSGTVKKLLGLKLQSIKPKDGERRYSIVG
jgi:hypothetical protein